MADDSSSGSESNVQSTAQAIAAVAKEVPIYQDLVQPGARELGKGIGGLLAFLMGPFKRLGVAEPETVEKFTNELQSSLADIPAEISHLLIR